MGNKPMLKIQRRVVESIFSESNISEKFEKLINCTQFISYKKMILSKCEAQAEIYGIQFDEKRKEEISCSIISILQICLYKMAIEEYVSKKGKTELTSELCSLFDMPIARRSLHWLRTEKGAYQLCKFPKMLEEYNFPFDIKQTDMQNESDCIQWIATEKGVERLE